MVNPRTPRGTGEDRQKPCLLIGTQAATARCQRRAKSTPAIIVFLFYLQSACLRLPLPYCLLPSGKVQRRCRIDGGAILDPGRLHVAHKTTCRRSRFPQGGQRRHHHLKTEAHPTRNCLARQNFDAPRAASVPANHKPMCFVAVVAARTSHAQGAATHPGRSH